MGRVGMLHLRARNEEGFGLLALHKKGESRFEAVAVDAHRRFRPEWARAAGFTLKTICGVQSAEAKTDRDPGWERKENQMFKQAFKNIDDVLWKEACHQ